ncbi:hypothetical protein DTO271G3_323 [Paecilomyces variotii]|nr:hypothetical protein DTO271G3_323 [Paecilomyces variotii]
MLFRKGAYKSRFRHRAKPIALAILIVYGIYCLFFADSTSDNLVSRGNRRRGSKHARPSHVPLPPLKKDLVVASMTKDDTSWLFEYFPDWHKSIYVVDDEDAELTVEINKGRESMVYLTYIIDNYDNLPDNMLFIHSLRYQWHNDDPYYDGVPMLRNFQIPYLEAQGYVNLRCVWNLGCPSEIRPFHDTHREDVHAGEYFKTGFMELFPESEVPEVVGVSCCAQFGVTKWKIRERPKSDYEHFRNWLKTTDLTDELSGRIMEYSWHMIFGMEPVHCPDVAQCYCNVFGLCNLNCDGPDSCDNRYILPPYSTLPKGWPYKGWDGEDQDPSRPIWGS